MNLRRVFRDFYTLPWRNTIGVLRERFSEDNLGLTASSLTFTTTIALVPFFTVVLAIFTAFPMFAKVQGLLQQWLLDSLIPPSIGKQVIGYLTLFASKASRLGVVGLVALFVTSLALILTIDKTLNSIWRVRRPRPLGQRVLIYWAAITIGPLLLGASLSLTSFVATLAGPNTNTGMTSAGVRLFLDSLEFALLAGGVASLYKYVPNTTVKWAHALTGGIFVAVGFEVAKRLLAYYISFVPTYSMLYGAFATVPILLIWIYVAWLIVLLGAVVAAYLPSLIAGIPRRARANGWQFQMAVELLQHLFKAAGTARRGMNTSELCDAMRVDGLQIEGPMETLVALGWVGRLNEVEDNEEARFVMLADPRDTPLAPLLRDLLLPDDQPLASFWQRSGMRQLTIADLLRV